eukprot:CAMPEP_0114996878 /NCGR_PEP_ID=MMETSP0216-20121206/14576_1 /TAXON_ID=223996 /ORGANISM="Protocruzia adherens, Strain Boccale" /LENGTH=1103 /DNA_ID=CAMNT_0002361173 /DNA_START=31 /DNA_END=3342 /DNA_ORIENTATION=-
MEGSLNQAHYDSLVQLLPVLFGASSQAERKAVSDQLNELSKDAQTHMATLIHIIASSKEGNDLGFHASIHLRQFIRSGSESKMSTTDRIQVCNMILPVVFSETVPIVVKRQNVDTLSQVMLGETKSADGSYLVASTLFDQAVAKMSSENSETLAGVLLVLEILLSDEQSAERLAFFFASGCNSLIPLGEKFSGIASQEITKMIESQDASQQGTIAAACEMLRSVLGVILLGLTNLHSYLDHLTNLRDEGPAHKAMLDSMTQFVMNRPYALSFGQILSLQLSHPDHMQGSVISITNMSNLDSLLNDIKLRAFQILNLVISFTCDADYRDAAQCKLEQSPFLSLTSACVTLFMNSLLSLCSDPEIDLEKQLANKYIEPLVVECLKLLTKTAREREFYPAFAEHKKTLLVNVILVLLRAGRDECDKFTEDPDDFVALAVDACDKQKSDVYKTAAAELLELICDHIDGAITFISYFVCCTIDFAIKYEGDLTQLDAQNYAPLVEFKDCVFLTKTPLEIQIETCLVALTVFSYIIPKREDLKILIENLIHRHLEPLCHSKSGLIRSRFCLLMGYYSEILFDKENYQKTFVDTISFLIRSLMDQELGVALQAVDSLGSTITDADLVPRVGSTVNQLFPLLISIVRTTQLHKFFDMLLDMIRPYATCFDDSIVQLIEALVERVRAELDSLANSGEKKYIMINKCWNVLRAISENTTLISKYYNEIETTMLPLFEYMEDPKNIEFDDDILLAITSFMKIRKTVSDNLWVLYPHLPKFYQKYKGMLANLLQTLNCYMVYGKERLANNQPDLEVLVDIGVNALFSEHASLRESIHSEGAILLQIILQVFEPNCIQFGVPKIIENVVNRINQGVNSNNLMARLQGVLISAVANNPTLALEGLERTGYTSAFLDTIKKRTSIFGHIYERKLLVIGLSTLVVQPSVLENIPNEVPPLMEVIINVLQEQKNKETKVTKAQKKAIYRDAESSDDESDDDDDDDDVFDDDDHMGGRGDDLSDTEEGSFDQVDEKDAKIMLSDIISPLKEADEYHFFKQVLQNLQAKYQPLLQEVVGKLSPEKQKGLKEVLISQRITVSGNGESRYTVRPIARARRFAKK